MFVNSLIRKINHTFLSNIQNQTKLLPDLLILSVLLAINGFFLNWNAFRFIDFFDMGVMVDTAWRVVVGQRPYADFILTLPPVHIYMNVFFFRLCGFGKLSILLHLLTVSSILIFFTYYISRLRLSRIESFLITALTMISFDWACAHPWYTMNAHFWGLLALYAVMAALLKNSIKRPFLNYLFSGFLVCVSLFTKQNIGILYLGLLIGIVVLGKEKLRNCIMFGLGLLAGFLFVWWTMIPSLSLFWHYVSDYSKMASDRFKYFQSLTVWFFDGYWLFCLPLIPFLIPMWKKNKQWVLMLFGLWGVGTVACFTSSLQLYGKMQPVGPMALVAFLLIKDHYPDYRTRKFPLILVSRYLLVALLIGMILWHARLGIRLAAWPYLADQPNEYTALTIEPLKGWKAYAFTNKFFEPLAEYVRDSIPKDDSMLILTDAQLLNAMFGRKPYPHSPWLWHVNYTPKPGEDLEKVRRAIRENPPDWIIYHRIPTCFMLSRIVPYLDMSMMFAREYVLEKDFGNYLVYKRKKI